jgi:hypothetical protein
MSIGSAGTGMRELSGDVRTLANQFIFDCNHAITNTPETLTAQKMVVAAAREYLAKLARRYVARWDCEAAIWRNSNYRSMRGAPARA